MKHIQRLFACLVLGFAFIATPNQADSKVTKAPPSPPPKGGPTSGLTIKSFQGILTGPGSVGTLQKLGYIDFRCDPKSLNWHIRVKGYSTKGGGANTLFIGDPNVCDHVEVIMYYDPNAPIGTGTFDGIAISVRKL